MVDYPNKPKWEALLRGQVMGTTTAKFMQVIRMLDQKAQIMILLNSILIPFCIRAYQENMFTHASVISIITSLLSISAAIICIYPKRKHRKKEDPEINLLHFNDIGHMDRQEFVDMFLPEFNDPSRLANLVVNDLYDTSKNAIIPKYVWLKIAYGVFFFGNLLAIIVAFLMM